MGSKKVVIEITGCHDCMCLDDTQTCKHPLFDLSYNNHVWHDVGEEIFYDNCPLLRNSNG